MLAGTVIDVPPTSAKLSGQAVVRDVVELVQDIARHSARDLRALAAWTHIAQSPLMRDYLD